MLLSMRRLCPLVMHQLQRMRKMTLSWCVIYPCQKMSSVYRALRVSKDRSAVSLASAESTEPVPAEVINKDASFVVYDVAADDLWCLKLKTSCMPNAHAVQSLKYPLNTCDVEKGHMMQGSSGTPALGDEEFAQHQPKHHVGRESMKLRHVHSAEQPQSSLSLTPHLGTESPSVELSSLASHPL